jgi:hypothetical protein
MQYNTSRSHLTIKEYGRHIHTMVAYVLTIEDRVKRSQQAANIVELMAVLNPHLKNIEDFKHTLWDHLHVLSNFQLDVDAPYPPPLKEVYEAKPAPLPYPKRKPKYYHLGKNIELVIGKALAEPNQEKKDGFANAIAYYMKLSYSNWHKELMHDDAIRSELNSITQGALEFSSTPYIKHRTQSFEREEFASMRPGGNNRRQNFSNNRNNRNNGGGNNNNRNRNGNGPARPSGIGGNNPRNANFKKRFK